MVYLLFNDVNHVGPHVNKHNGKIRQISHARTLGLGVSPIISGAWQLHTDLSLVQRKETG